MHLLGVRASKTAEFMALFRALETLDPARLFEDPVATAFLEPSLGVVARAARWLTAHRLITRVIDSRWPGPRPSAVARTRYIDDEVTRALDDGFDQVCILGAGYDARAYRLAQATRARFFEVDHPATQRKKHEKLVRHLGTVPEHVVFVPVDFDRDDLAASLRAAGFRTDARSIFVWEGVTNYLTAAAVDQTFRTLGGLGLCRVVFTYMHRGVIDGSVQFAEAPRWSGTVRSVGEPFKFGFLPEELAAYLEERGFSLVEDLTTEAAGRRYFPARGRSDRGSELYHVAIAETAGTR